MTVFLNDPMDTLANWTGTATIVPGGFTGNGAQIAGGSALTTPIPAGSQWNQLHSFFRWRVDNLGVARPICQYRSGASVNEVTLRASTAGALEVAAGGSGAATVATSANGLVGINTWYGIDFYATIADAGSLLVYLNGTQIINATPVDTHPGTGGPVVLNTFVLSGPGSGATAVFDEVFLDDQRSTPVAPTMKVWNGSAWVDGQVKVYNGTAFVNAAAVKTYNGTAWV